MDSETMIIKAYLSQRTLELRFDFFEGMGAKRYLGINATYTPPYAYSDHGPCFPFILLPLEAFPDFKRLVSLTEKEINERGWLKQTNSEEPDGSTC